MLMGRTHLVNGDHLKNFEHNQLIIIEKNQVLQIRRDSPKAWQRRILAYFNAVFVPQKQTCWHETTNNVLPF